MQLAVAVAPDDPTPTSHPGWILGRIHPPAGGQARRVVVLDLSPAAARLQLVLPTASPLTHDRFWLSLGWQGISADFRCCLIRATTSHLNAR